MICRILRRVGRTTLQAWDHIDPTILGRTRRRSRRVQGWLTRSEETALFRLARSVSGDLAIVELGAWMGRSALLLAAGSHCGHRALVHSVDLFRPAGCAQEDLARLAGGETVDFLERFRDNLAGMDTLSQLVRPIRGETSEQGSLWEGGPIGLLFVDGDHSEEGVRRDWEGWRDRLAPGGIVAFHDYRNPEYPGVARVVDELVETGCLTDGKLHDSLFVAGLGGRMLGEKSL